MPSDFAAARAARPAAKRWGDRACAVHDAFVGRRWTDDSGNGGLNRLRLDLQVSTQSPSVAAHCVQVAGPLQLAACAADPLLALRLNQFSRRVVAPMYGLSTGSSTEAADLTCSSIHATNRSNSEWLRKLPILSQGQALIRSTAADHDNRRRTARPQVLSAITRARQPRAMSW